MTQNEISSQNVKLRIPTQLIDYNRLLCTKHMLYPIEMTINSKQTSLAAIRSLNEIYISLDMLKLDIDVQKVLIHHEIGHRIYAPVNRATELYLYNKCIKYIAPDRAHEMLNIVSDLIINDKIFGIDNTRTTLQDFIKEYYFDSNDLDFRVHEVTNQSKCDSDCISTPMMLYRNIICARIMKHKNLDVTSELPTGDYEIYKLLFYDSRQLHEKIEKIAQIYANTQYEENDEKDHCNEDNSNQGDEGSSNQGDEGNSNQGNGGNSNQGNGGNSNQEGGGNSNQGDENTQQPDTRLSPHYCDTTPKFGKCTHLNNISKLDLDDHDINELAKIIANDNLATQKTTELPPDLRKKVRKIRTNKIAIALVNDARSGSKSLQLAGIWSSSDDPMKLDLNRTFGLHGAFIPGQTTCKIDKVYNPYNGKNGDINMLLDVSHSMHGLPGERLIDAAYSVIAMAKEKNHTVSLYTFGSSNTTLAINSKNYDMLGQKILSLDFNHEETIISYTTQAIISRLKNKRKRSTIIMITDADPHAIYDVLPDLKTLKRHNNITVIIVWPKRIIKLLPTYKFLRNVTIELKNTVDQMYILPSEAKYNSLITTVL